MWSLDAVVAQKVEPEASSPDKVEVGRRRENRNWPKGTKTHNQRIKDLKLTPDQRERL